MRPWWSALVVVVGCGAPPARVVGEPTPTAPAPDQEVEIASPPPPAVSIDIAYDAVGDRWRVGYRFASPVGGMRYRRNRHLFRDEEGWTLETTGVRWDERDGYEVAVVEGEPRREIVVSFATDTKNREKDYKLNLDFTDGSRLLYTGHLAAWPMEGPDDTAISWGLEAPGRGVVVLDAVGEGRLRWSRSEVDDRGGTYVYVGNIEPLRTERLTAIVDPGMPAEMRESTLADLPRLFDWYGERVGHQLDFDPLVLVSFGTEGSGRSLKGGTLTGLVQLQATGRGWLEGSHQDHWFHFLSHEAFHLWNGQLFPKRGDRTEEWLSEGLSDLFADQALRHFGYVDDAGFDAAMVKAANTCLLQAGEAPLLGPKLPYGTYYACGAVYLHVLDAELKNAGSSLDAVLGRMWARSRQTGGYATADLVFEVQRTTGTATSLGWLTTALYEGIPSPAADTLSSWLAGAGIETRAVGPTQAGVGRQACRRAIVAHLSTCGCGYSVDFSAPKTEVTLRGCSDRTLTQIGGRSLTTAPCEALEALDRARVVPACAPRSTALRLLAKD